MGNIGFHLLLFGENRVSNNAVLQRKLKSLGGNIEKRVGSQSHGHMVFKLCCQADGDVLSCVSTKLSIALGTCESDDEIGQCNRQLLQNQVRKSHQQQCSLKTKKKNIKTKPKPE